MRSILRNFPKNFTLHAMLTDLHCIIALNIILSQPNIYESLTPSIPLTSILIVTVVSES